MHDVWMLERVFSTPNCGLVLFTCLQADDATRVVLAHPICTEPLVLTGLAVKSRFIKIAVNALSHNCNGGVLNLMGIKGRCIAGSDDSVRAASLAMTEKLFHDAVNEVQFQKGNLYRTVLQHRQSNTKAKTAISKIYWDCVQANVVVNECRATLARLSDPSALISKHFVANGSGSQDADGRPGLQMGVNQIQHVAHHLVSTIHVMSGSAFLKKFTDRCLSALLPAVLSQRQLRQVFFSFCVYGLKHERSTLSRLLLYKFIPRPQIPNFMAHAVETCCEEAANTGGSFEHVLAALAAFIEAENDSADACEAITRVSDRLVALVSQLLKSSPHTSLADTKLVWLLVLLQKALSQTSAETTWPSDALNMLCAELLAWACAQYDHCSTSFSVTLADFLLTAKLHSAIISGSFIKVPGDVFASMLRCCLRGGRWPRRAMVSLVLVADSLCDAAARQQVYADFHATLFQASERVRDGDVVDHLEFLLELSADLGNSPISFTPAGLELLLQHVASSSASTRTLILCFQFLRLSQQKHLAFDANLVALVRKCVTSPKLVEQTASNMTLILEPFFDQSLNSASDNLLCLLVDDTLPGVCTQGFSALFMLVSKHLSTALDKGHTLLAPVQVAVIKLVARINVLENSGEAMSAANKMACIRLVQRVAVAASASESCQDALTQALPAIIHLYAATLSAEVHVAVCDLFIELSSALTSPQPLIEALTMALGSSPGQRNMSLVVLGRATITACKGAISCSDASTASFAALILQLGQCLMPVMFESSVAVECGDLADVWVGDKSIGKLLDNLNPITKKMIEISFEPAKTAVAEISLVFKDDISFCGVDISFSKTSGGSQTPFVLRLDGGRSKSSLSPICLAAASYTTPNMFEAKANPAEERVIGTLVVSFDRPPSADKIVIERVQIYGIPSPGYDKATPTMPEETASFLVFCLELLSPSQLQAVVSNQQFGTTLVYQAMDMLLSHASITDGLHSTIESIVSLICEASEPALQSMLQQIQRQVHSNHRAVARVLHMLCTSSVGQTSTLASETLLRLANAAPDNTDLAQTLAACVGFGHSDATAVCATIGAWLSATTQMTAEGRNTRHVYSALMCCNVKVADMLWGGIGTMIAHTAQCAAEILVGVAVYPQGLALLQSREISGVSVLDYVVRHTLHLLRDSSSTGSTDNANSDAIHPHHATPFLWVLSIWCTLSGVIQSHIVSTYLEELGPTLCHACDAVPQLRKQSVRLFEALSRACPQSYSNLAGIMKTYIDSNTGTWPLILIDTFILTPPVIPIILPTAAACDRRMRGSLVSMPDEHVLACEIATSLDVSTSQIKLENIVSHSMNAPTSAMDSLPIDVIIAAQTPILVVVRDSQSNKTFGGFVPKHVTLEDVQQVRSIGEKKAFLFNLSDGAVFRSSSSRSGVRVCEAADSPVHVASLVWGDMDLVVHLQQDLPCTSRTNVFQDTRGQAQTLVPRPRFSASFVEIWSVRVEAPTSVQYERHSSVLSSVPMVIFDVSNPYLQIREVNATATMDDVYRMQSTAHSANVRALTRSARMLDIAAHSPARWLDLRHLPSGDAPVTASSDSAVEADSTQDSLLSAFITCGGLQDYFQRLQGCDTIGVAHRQCICDWLIFASIPAYVAAVQRSQVMFRLLRLLASFVKPPSFDHQECLGVQLGVLRTSLQEQLDAKEVTRCTESVLERLLTTLQKVTKVEPRGHVLGHSAHNGLGVVENNDSSDGLPTTPSAKTELGKRNDAQMFWEKGTGFGSGSVASVWDQNQWLAQRRRDQAFVAELLETIGLCLKVPRPETVEGGCDPVYTLVDHSCLVPVLCEYLHTDSIMDLEKSISLYDAILQLVQTLVFDPLLAPAVLLVDAQHPSIASLVESIADIATIYQKRLAVCTPELDKAADLLARQEEGTGAPNDATSTKFPTLLDHLGTTSSLVSNYASQSTNTNTAPAPAADIEDPDQGYVASLQSSQFREAHVQLNHHYAKHLATDAGAGRKRMARLAQELGTLAKSLPLSLSSSVLVRCDKKRFDFMKVLITGPDNTPYSNGCFEFDVYFPAAYPESPPLINLQTTGGGTARFNPNLYACGKVCLSILNTWHGRPEERWNERCTILQLLVCRNSAHLWSVVCRCV